MSDTRVVVFDWVRVWVTLLVVHHHASLAYTGSPYRRWYVLDERGTIVFDAIVRVIGPFAMPAFFLLAGYLTARSLRPRPGFLDDGWVRRSRMWGSPPSCCASEMKLRRRSWMRRDRKPTLH